MCQLEVLFCEQERTEKGIITKRDVCIQISVALHVKFVIIDIYRYSVCMKIKPNGKNNSRREC